MWSPLLLYIVLFVLCARSGEAIEDGDRTISGAASEDRDSARVGPGSVEGDRTRSYAGSEDGIGARSSTGSENGVRIVKIAQGTLRGHKDPNTGVFVFYGIPYATVPTGSQKFMAPLPGPTWQQPLDAIDKGIVCPQIETFWTASKSKQKDCLLATVYVSDTEENNLPVVVYVHGGAFQFGFADMIPPDPFMINRKMIAVTFNYRLGIGGFLCIGTKQVPGNAGLKDQLALLRWVKENIASFGGNPNDVTIDGRSAGALAVDFLMLSKTTEGLFTKVIPESGAASGAIAIQVDPIKTAKNFASNLGFREVDDVYALEEFFVTTSTDMFYKKSDIEYFNSTLGFAPCVERDTGTEIFLHDAPINILKEGKYKKVPLLFGFDRMEGLLKVPNFDEWKGKMDRNFSDFLPENLLFENDVEKEKVAKLIREFYFDDKPIDDNSVFGYIDFFGDVMFIYPILQSVQLHVEAGHDQVYLYEYSFVDEDSTLVPNTNIRGAGHCAHCLHIINGRKYIDPNDTKESEKYKNMQSKLQEIWFNFITTGKPVPDGSSLPPWPSVGLHRSPYMSLGNKLELRRDSLIQKRVEFWDDIYSKYYRMHVPLPRPLNKILDNK